MTTFSWRVWPMSVSVAVSESNENSIGFPEESRIGWRHSALKQRTNHNTASPLPPRCLANHTVPSTNCYITRPCWTWQHFVNDIIVNDRANADATEPAFIMRPRSRRIVLKPTCSGSWAAWDVQCLVRGQWSAQRPAPAMSLSGECSMKRQVHTHHDRQTQTQAHAQTSTNTTINLHSAILNVASFVIDSAFSIMVIILRQVKQMGHKNRRIFSLHVLAAMSRAWFVPCVARD